jgi:crotonobetainyl-CoA:carnitine CoA-transferase CaiB-like acyl-CoA transferase
MERLQPERRPAFMALFEEWLQHHTRYEAMARAQAQRVPFTAVNGPADVLHDPHFQARGYFTPVDHPVAGTLPYTGAPFRMQDAPAVPLRPAPLLGEHTDTVLRQRLGFSAPELEDLRRHGII